jgi:hypothetical protein
VKNSGAQRGEENCFRIVSITESTIALLVRS